MGKKYNYQVSFEDAIKNGVSKEEYARFSSKLWCLNNISNELAEMNRLTRLRMSREGYGSSEGTVHAYSDEVLKDQA